MNQIETTRNDCAGTDEYEEHRPEDIFALRDAVAAGWSEGRMTWALSWQALQDRRAHYVEARRLVKRFHEDYGDDVTFIPGGYFANAYNTREQVNRDLREGVALAADIVGGGYRPKSVVAGFLAAENQRYLAEEEGIHVCQGNLWSQFEVDNQDGDGSICYPYYPSTEHFCKPAQGEKDYIDCVSLDGFTVDFLHARGGTEEWHSRIGVGPLETFYKMDHEDSHRQVMHTMGTHFDRGFELNGFAWVTVCWEAPIMPKLCRAEDLTQWLSAVRQRWPEAKLVTQGEFGNAWRDHFRDNDALDYRFIQRGSGLDKSHEELEIQWRMNKQFRLALLRNWQENSPPRIIDFTRYDLPAAEPQELTRRWSLLGEINQKQTRPQDRPVLLDDLPKESQGVILNRYPDICELSSMEGIDG